MLPAGHGLAVPLGVGSDQAGLDGRRRLEAEDLLDGVGNEARVGHQLVALIGMLGQELARPADEPGGGLVPSSGQKADVAEDLIPGEGPGGPILVGELGLQELGHQIVGGVVGSPVDVLGELHPHAAGHRRFGHHAVLEPEAVVEPVADGLLVVFGDAQEHADRPHGHLGAEVLDEIEPAASRRAGQGYGRRTP